MKKIILIIIFLSVSFSLFSENDQQKLFYMFSDLECKPGDIVPVIILTENSNEYNAVLEKDSKDYTRSGFHSFTAKNQAVKLDIAVSLLGISNTLKSGNYKIKILNKQEKTIVKNEIAVVRRKFRSEDIHLNDKLVSIRTENREDRNREYAELKAILTFFDSNIFYRNSIFNFPIVGEKWGVTSYYGDRRTYVYPDNKRVPRSSHLGMDYGAVRGNELIAAADGKVVMARSRIVTGNTVVLEHWSGVFTLYYHLDSLAVSEGMFIKAGQNIGTVGSTGLSTGSHLHWEMRVNNVAVDPEVYLTHSLLDKSRLFSIIKNGFEKRG